MSFFLKLPQINQMKIESFSFGGRSKTGSKFEAKEAAISRLRDETSIALFRAAVNGEKFDEAVVIAKNPKSGVIFRYKMKMASIDYYQTENDGVSESLGLKFTTLIIK